MQQSFDDFTKAGFARLLKSFEDNTDDVVKLTRAFALANKAHKGQVLNKDEPYLNHLLRVALVLIEEFQIRDAELASAALLHDALENGLPEKDIIAECGDKVAEIARSVSEPKKEEGEKGLETYYARIAKESKEARSIKLAERLDVARSMKNFPYKERAIRFKDETQKYVVPLAQNTDERFVFKLSVALYEIK